MTWFKVDDGFHAHRKVMALTETQTGRQAIALWTLAGSWCADQLSNGAIPKQLARKFGFTSREVQALLDANLWTETADGYAFCDWADYQPTKEQVLEKREKERAKKQRVRGGVPDDVPGGQPEAVPLPPSRPVPSRSVLRTRDAGPSEPESPSTAALVRQAFARFYEQRNAIPWPKDQAKADEVHGIAEWVDDMASREGIGPDAVVARVVKNFASDDYVRTVRKPWAHFAKSYADYWQAPARTAANNNASPIGRGRVVY